MSRKQIVTVAVIILLLLGGAAYYLTSRAPSDAVAPAADGFLAPDRISPADKAMGNPGAPITMIEYFAQICSVCARFDQEVFPLLKAKYIDTGKVRYVMRIYPIRPLDQPSYRLDLCVPPDHFFQSVDLLFRNQPLWDAEEYPVSDPHGELIKMARIMGLTPEQAEACMNSTAQDAAINQAAQEATARYNIEGTPTFVIDFKKVDMGQKTWDEVQRALDAAL